MKSTIEIHHNGKWHQAAEIHHHNDYQATFEYLPMYQFGDIAKPVSINLPINTPRICVERGQLPNCPSFIFDLVPQGLGRKYLLKNINRPLGDAMVIPLAQIGAFNPIGNLRLDTAVNFYEQWKAGNPADIAKGFTEEEITNKEEDFANYIWLHAMLVAGTTGVQGAAPKFLLTQNKDGLWFADSALPDDQATNHWLVKLPRGKTQADIKVINLEAKYYQVAKDCGIRTQGQCYVRNDMLFFERFDRQVVNGNTVRLHQESLQSVAGIAGFPDGVSQFSLANAIMKHATHPEIELAEFIKRDILNKVLGNTDNHGRNTAMQITQEGVVQLTPLYDFAPMYLDPQIVLRSCRWIVNGAELENTDDILDHIDASDHVKNIVRCELNEFSTKLSHLETIMQTHEVDTDVIQRRSKSIENAIRAING